MNNKKKIDLEIEQIVAAGPEAQRRSRASGSNEFYPGGHGGGGKRRGTGRSVVLPHARTYAGCTTCGRMHSTEDHEEHQRLRDPSYVPRRKSAKTKPSSKTKTKTKTKVKKPTRATKATTATRATKVTKTRAKNPRPPKSPKINKPKGHRQVTHRAPARSPASLLDLENVVLQTIPHVGPEGRFAPEKVFVADLYHQIMREWDIPGLTLAHFKRWLIDANRQMIVDLARADVVGAMDPRQVAESTISDLGSTFHFVIDRHAQRY